MSSYTITVYDERGQIVGGETCHNVSFESAFETFRILCSNPEIFKGLGDFEVSFVEIGDY